MPAGTAVVLRSPRQHVLRNRHFLCFRLRYDDRLDQEHLERGVTAANQVEAEVGSWEKEKSGGKTLAGTEAEAFLDPEPPRSLTAVDRPARVVAIDCAPPEATDRWTLHQREMTGELGDEIRSRVETRERERG